MKAKHAVLITVLLLATVARADTIITAAGSNIPIDWTTISFSTTLDVTTATVLSSSFTLTGTLATEQFAPVPPALYANGAFYAWSDSRGDTIGLGEYDYFQLMDPAAQFPAPGVYPASMLELNRVDGYGYGWGTAGEITVTDPPAPTPEDDAWILVLIGLAVALGLSPAPGCSKERHAQEARSATRPVSGQR